MVAFKEHNKMNNRIPTWIPIFVKPLAIIKNISSLQIVDLVSLYFIFYFYFLFILFFYFSIFRIARVRVRSNRSHCHISHNLMVWSQHWSLDLGEQSRGF